MKMDQKKTLRLRDKLPVVLLEDYDHRRALKKGRAWYRVAELAKEYNATASTILNWIRSGKLEGCVLCGVIHGRRPKIGGDDGQSDQSSTPENA